MLGGLEKYTMNWLLPVMASGLKVSTISETSAILQEKTLAFATDPLQFCTNGKKFLP
jgi:hypothetical protein